MKFLSAALILTSFTSPCFAGSPVQIWPELQSALSRAGYEPISAEVDKTVTVVRTNRGDVHCKTSFVGFAIKEECYQNKLLVAAYTVMPSQIMREGQKRLVQPQPLSSGTPMVSSGPSYQGVSSKSEWTVRTYRPRRKSSLIEKELRAPYRNYNGLDLVL